ncbi:MAG: ABC transporter [Methanosarcinaceae archaeon]|nr:ABC transporter [Methanosarcinaceae archaeon]
MAGWVTIAKWEVLRSKQKFDIRSTVFLSVALAMLFLAAFAATNTNMSMDQNIYRVVITDPYLQPMIDADQRFDIMIADEQDERTILAYDTELLIIGRDVYVKDTEKGTAAADALKRTLKNYREIVLTSYNDINNSHPVWITVHYMERSENFQIMSGERRDIEQTGSPGTTPGMDPAGTSDSETLAGVTTREGERIRSVDDLQKIGEQAFFEKQTIATPSFFSPPIPFTAILYSFLFIFPIYFVSQFYSSTIMDERTNKKCELVLVAPLHGRDIVIGKTMPYLVTIMLTLAAVTFYIKGIPGSMAEILTVLQILATVFPIVLLFLSLSFFSAILARSFKDLTFAMVFLSVVITGYLFFPAMFANVHTISTISPMTLVVHLIEGNDVRMAEYVFSTLPFYLISITVYAFGTFIFREEDLFTQKPLTEKVLDTIERFLTYPAGSIFLLSIIFIPFVYMTQLMLIVMLFNLPLPYSILGMIILAAFVEELVKSIGILTLVKRKMVILTPKSTIRLAVLAGGGFFVGEKLISLITLSAIASSAFGSVMTLGALLLIPLLLHVCTVLVVVSGLYVKNTRWYQPLVLLASLLHGLYNLYLLRGIIYG